MTVRAVNFAIPTEDGDVHVQFPVLVALGACESPSWNVREGHPYLVFSVTRVGDVRVAHRFDEVTHKPLPPVPLYLINFLRPGGANWLEAETRAINERYGHVLRGGNNE